MIDSINIEKNSIQFGGAAVYPPFARETVDAILGIPRIEEKDIEIDKNRFSHQITYSWDQLGIISTAEKRTNHYTNFIVYLDKIDTKARKIDIFFHGQILIGGKDYTKATFKPDKIGLCHQKTIGPFVIYTILADHLEDLRDSRLAEWMSKEVEITYKAPRPKSSVYDLKKLDEPVLHFDSFQFKLLVMEELMYNKELLSPRFDIYDFAKNNPKRDIDVDSEGYEAIPEARKWFKDYQIPARYSPEITELIWDGGLEVFHQIYPFWDGEDDFFSVKKLSMEEVRQLTGLKKVITGGGFSKKAISILEGINIEVDDS